MAIPTANLSHNLQIEAVQTCPPRSVTAEPRPTRRVSVTDDLAGTGIFSKCLNMILYYNKSTEEDTGYLVAGWFKESLGKAMSDLPMLSGRFRVPAKGGEPAVVANDSGVRLLEAKIPMSLNQFMDSKDKEDIEAKLVFWKDIDEEIPQYSPLVYVQVTNFECGGYAVGITCSILLADLFMMSDFLHRWANIHSKLMEQIGEKNKVVPLFYFHNDEKSKLIPTILTNSDQRKNGSQTIIFKNVVARENPGFETEPYKNLSFQAIKKAEKQIGVKIGPKISLIVQVSTDMMKIGSFQKDEDEIIVGSKSNGNYEDVLSNARWEELGEICFHENNKPDYVSYWIGSKHGDDAILMAIPSQDKGLHEKRFVLSVPN
ncbi:stemmadenine O-acetyltransferase-like [Rutidosis leptorrhynchoides]|uniref:stemmadenine O-acetyltransferase-like n=1 Tax=Rutidosis leptorrhynchoides TaxID=125765 RepID=UPI003A98F528